MAPKRHRLAQRRKTVGHTQESLAEKLGVDRTTVVRWERTESEPQPWIRPKLADALNVTLEQLTRMLDRVEDGSGSTSDRLAALRNRPASVDLEAVRQLRLELERLNDSYDTAPSTAVLPEAGRLCHEVRFLCSNARGEGVRRALRRVEAGSATLMGQLIWDASQRRDNATAASYYDRAANAARQSGYADAEAQAWLRLSFVALYGEGDPAAGLARASHAAEIAGRSGSHAMRASALLHVAEASAMMGETMDCERSLGEAEQQLSQADDADPARSLVSAGQLHRIAGSCHLFLGNPLRAQCLLAAGLPTARNRKKSYGIALANLGLARLRLRDLEGAVEALHGAIDVVEVTRGGGAVNVLFRANRELRAWRDRTDVQEIMDRTLDLMVA
ncbi:helix-turn-helix transcriptional regulator [Micromonospora sp. NBC_01412]|uniref:helix-turn-helix transcriptional regulator n=1 Tax=Micromonospora sp. NBC_01412 TaxID=2903590 RepID=UPI00325083C9